MEPKYNPRLIEEHWQNQWNQVGVFECHRDEKRQKYYCLEMFPYPSGKIHMGHVRNYAIGDAIARFRRMQGYNVLHPIGWDAFGLPAENAAMERKAQPAEWTKQNIDAMRVQLKKLGLLYDWDREIATCDPDYYRWGQWIFLQLYRNGLAYKKEAEVNWCPRCRTVLANEQVIEGKCWRHAGVLVESRRLNQWFFRITDYAERLLQGHDRLRSHWPERVLTMQKNWIGKSTGALIRFKDTGGKEYPIYTTRPDTVFGVTYLAVSPDHPLVGRMIGDENNTKLSEFVEALRAESGRAEDLTEKKGMDTGIRIRNPFNDKIIPLWIANFVLMDYGTGIIMSVPAHDQRDFEFAKKYHLPIVPVIVPENLADKGSESWDELVRESAFEDNGIMVQSGGFSGMRSEEGKRAIISYIESHQIGERQTRYRLRDWLISRQRYWGNPIPVVYCAKCGIVPVPESDLPVLLPPRMVVGHGEGSPLTADENFVRCNCPDCGRPARRETDTMDTFVDSSWYFLRYESPHEQTALVSKEDYVYWRNVDQYIGGIEHAVMHLLYARFFQMFLYDIGVVTDPEPFRKLLTQGMVVNTTYYDPVHKRYFWKDELGEDLRTSPIDPKVELRIQLDKMSKSKHNGVDPDAMIEKYGADTVRLFSLFGTPPERDLEWSNQGIEGCYRFAQRVYRLVLAIVEAMPPKIPDGISDEQRERILRSSEGRSLYIERNRVIKKVTEDIERRYGFNTAIAALMEFTNAVSSTFHSWQMTELMDWQCALLSDCARSLALMLSPFAPHLSDEILGKTDGLMALEMSWPQYEEEYVVQDRIEVVFQVNGRVRSRSKVDKDIDKDVLRKMALEDPRVLRYTGGKDIRRVIVVPGKLVNIVI